MARAELRVHGVGLAQGADIWGQAVTNNCTEEQDDLYYMQVKGYCGNSLLWWREGKHGYTPDIKQAHVWTKEDAFAQHKCRPTEDFPWRKDYIDAHLQHHVNQEYVSRRHKGAV
jgi:hypothetical protein